MIIVKIMGGIGNQMFQYAFARELIHRGKNVKVDTSYYDNIPEKDTIRLSAHDMLGQGMLKASEKEIGYFLKKDSRKIWKAVRGLDRSKCHTPVYYENSEYYNPGIFEREDGYYIGYWQSEKYFSNVVEKVRQDYETALLQMHRTSQFVLERIQNCPCPVSVHVRGGDYYNSENVGVFGGICGAEYYKEAFELCNKKLPGCNFFVFTNDSELARRVLPVNEKYEINADGGEDGYRDIFLMSRCSHNIIANSSFSWWGAWLNPNKSKLILAPGRWNHSKKMSNIYCESWLKIT